MSNQEERTERLLALILLSQMKGASQQEKAVQLNIAGFSNVEIANLLETSADVIAHVLYVNRKGKISVKPKKKIAGE